MKMIIVSACVVAVLAVSSCSGNVTDEGLDSFVESVRANGYAKGYDDDAVKNMARNVCDTLKATGDDARAEGVLDNYSQLSADERRELVDVARGTACSSS